MPRLFALGLGASLVGALFGTALGAPSATTSASYEYIVVGSGAGGGPLASRLAIAGHSVLLIEAGDDQGMNVNYTVPSFQPAVSEDPKLRWDMFVNHYQDPARAQRDPKYVYDVGGGQQYVGFNPPKNAKPLGILYVASNFPGCLADC
jgi:choline dehydrogenase